MVNPSTTPPPCAVSVPIVQYTLGRPARESRLPASSRQGRAARRPPAQQGSPDRSKRRGTPGRGSYIARSRASNCPALCAGTRVSIPWWPKITQAARPVPHRPHGPPARHARLARGSPAPPTAEQHATSARAGSDGGIVGCPAAWARRELRSAAELVRKQVGEVLLRHRRPGGLTSTAPGLPAATRRLPALLLPRHPGLDGRRPVRTEGPRGRRGGSCPAHRGIAVSFAVAYASIARLVNSDGRQGAPPPPLTQPIG